MARKAKPGAAAREAAQARREAGLPPAWDQLLRDLKRGKPILLSTWAEKRGLAQPTAHSALRKLQEQGHNINRVVVDGRPHYELKDKVARSSAPARTTASRAAAPAPAPAVPVIPDGGIDLTTLPNLDQTLTVCALIRQADGTLEIGLRNGSAIYRAEIKGRLELV